MKKLSIVLAAMLVLALLCSCAKPAPEAPAQADPEPAAPAAVHVTTFPAEILSAAGDMLMVDPTDADSTFGAASSVAVRLADGLVPVGADGWPIAVGARACAWFFIDAQSRERLVTGLAVNGKTVCALEILDRALGAAAVYSIYGAVVIAPAFQAR